MEFFDSLFNEALRFDPPAQGTSPMIVLHDETIGNLRLKAGDLTFIHIWALHHNPNEWQRPDEFLPDRWDHESPLYLTPKGTRRHPFSFMPFSSGRRICFGKTFADYAARTITSILVHNVDFEFVDKKWMKEIPQYNAVTNFDIAVPIIATPLR